MKMKLTALILCLLLVSGCQNNQEKEIKEALPTKETVKTISFQGCQTCHPDSRHDKYHNLPCTDCHRGNDNGRDIQVAHAGLVAMPAHPDFMEESCGGCHPENIKKCRSSLHFTLNNKINRIREHFGASSELISLTEISHSTQPATQDELVDDLLRRRCLRCHLYTSGDTYANTQRGTGCAACHMGFSNGGLLSHEMIGVPGDLQCLSCHYANFVGADYYGRYEHDFGNEYRTPYTTREEHIRPYGVEYHELVPDIHQQKGLACVDCHFAHELVSNQTKQKITCKTCHRVDLSTPEQLSLLPNLAIVDSTPILTGRKTGNKHPVPQMSHSAHELYGEIVSCQVCHSQWSFNDSTTHLLRNDSDDFEPWLMLYTQSSSTLENLLLTNFDDEAEELPPALPDAVTGELITGVWYKGYSERRWDRILVQWDHDGLIKVFRPILDLKLSYVDSDENVVFNNLQGSGKVHLPYTPHTTGKAGMFFMNRFAHLLNQEKNTPLEQ